MRPLNLVLSALTMFLFISCSGGGAGGGENKPKLAIELLLDPPSISLNCGEATTYVANVRIPGVGVNLYDDSRFGIQWSTTGGGLQSVQGQDIAWRTYTAPVSPGSYQVTLQSTYDPSILKTSIITVARAPIAQSLTASRTQVQLGESVELTPVFSNGTGTLSPGIGVVQSGVPVHVSPLQTTDFTLTVRNDIGRTVSSICTVEVQARGAFTPLASWTPFGGSTHAECTLPDGRVLTIAGGSPSNKSYILDPATWKFTPTHGSPSGFFPIPNLLPLNNGRVLLFSVNSSGSSSVEIFSPDLGTFKTLDTSSIQNEGIVKAILLGNGKVLLTTFKGVALYGINEDRIGPFLAFPTDFSFGLGLPYSPNQILFISYGTGGAAKGYLFNVETFSFTSFSGFLPEMGTIVLGQPLTTGKILLLSASIYSSGDASSAYLLDTTTGTCKKAAELLRNRDQYSVSALLKDGRVIIAGGNQNPKSVEIFDPSTSTFCKLPDLDSSLLSEFNFWDGSGYHTTILGDGRVLFLGRTTGAVFDPTLLPPNPPKLGSFVSTGTLLVPRHPGALTLLPSGQVLVTGGNQYDSQANQKVVELFDPTLGTFRRLGDLKTARVGHSATLLPDGKVLIFGGGGGFNSPTPLAEIYNPNTESSEGLSYEDWPKPGNKTVFLGGGNLFIVGGDRQSLIFNPVSSTFRSSGVLAGDAGNVGAAMLPNGKVLVVGERASGTGQVRQPGEIYDPISGLFQAAGLMGTTSSGAELISLSNGKVLALTSSHAECYDLSGGGFFPTGDYLISRGQVPAVPLADGSVLVLQGGVSSPSQIFLPAMNGGIGGFTPGPTALGIRMAFPRTVLLKDGRALFVDSDGCQIYQP